MQWFLYDFFGVIVDPRTVRRSFERRKWSRKALKAASIQKNDFARAEWISRLKDYHADQLVFVDESAGNAVTGDMKKGFCEREAPVVEKKEAGDRSAIAEDDGQQAVEEQMAVGAQLTEAAAAAAAAAVPPPKGQVEVEDGQDGQYPEGQLPLPTTLSLPLALPVNMKRDARWSVLPAYTIGNGYLPGFLVVQGAVNEEMFSEWLRQRVLPHCAPFPGPRSVLVMDPAGIHNTQVRLPNPLLTFNTAYAKTLMLIPLKGVHDLCNAAGVRIEYLPPNSPDFNPVEQSLDDIKTGVKAHKAELPLHPDFGSYLHSVIERDVAPGTKAKMHFKNACVVR